MDNGFVLINKPENWTSNDAVVYLRRITKIKKTGHAGTLDPFATGLLIVGIGREATKHLDLFHTLSKTYEAEIVLGAESDTLDKTGIIIENKIENIPTKKEIIYVLSKFKGNQTQIPPMYSAKKIEGKKLYKLARKGIEVKREPNNIIVHNIELEKYKYPFLNIKLTVSTGTYVRTLAHDIGNMLSTGAYCKELRRTSIGKYSIQNSLDLKSITKEDIHSNLFFPMNLTAIDKT